MHNGRRTRVGKKIVASWTMRSEEFSFPTWPWVTSQGGGADEGRAREAEPPKATEREMRAL